MIVETGYAFTLEDYIKNEHGGAKLVVNEENLESFPFTKEYPFSPEGQALANPRVTNGRTSVFSITAETNCRRLTNLMYDIRSFCQIGKYKQIILCIFYKNHKKL